MRCSVLVLFGSLVSALANSVFAQNVEYVSSTLWSDATGIAVQGNYAYCAYHNGLVVLDVSNSASPQFVSKMLFIGEGEGITVSGNLAYLADGGAGIQIIDISTPANPVLVSNFDTPGYAVDVILSGHYAYVADWWRGMSILDVADPMHPVWVGGWDTDPGSPCRPLLPRNCLSIRPASCRSVPKICNPPVSITPSPNLISVPRPAILVAIVIPFFCPALAIISASR